MAWIGANNVRMKNESSLYALDWDTTTASHQGMISNWEHHQNLGFQTIDAEKNECAKQWNGGWWYKKHTCARAYLTGEFFHENTTTFKGIYVDAFRWQQSLKRARMMFRSSTIRPCNNPCKNGGTCEHVADPVGHHCACTSEWCGTTCELKCENGGNCETVEDPPGHHCACTSGWCGAKCEVENPCENGGNCETVKDPPGHHCSCTSGWCGAKCEVENPCENGGNCETVKDPPGHHCACTSGWCGAKCEVENPCENGGNCETVKDPPYLTFDLDIYDII